MSDFTDMIVEGVLCETCGAYIDSEAPGHPRRCAGCEPVSDHSETKRQITDLLAELRKSLATGGES